MSERTIVQPNTLWVSAGKALGLGEKRDRLWWYSPEEAEAIRAELARRREKSAAQKEERRKCRAEARRAPTQTRTLISNEGRAVGASATVAASPPSRPAPRVVAPRPQRATGKFHTMPFIEDRDLYQAVKFALHMKAGGTSIPLACHRAARHYGVRIADVAREVGRTGARKALKNRVWSAYQGGRAGES